MPMPAPKPRIDKPYKLKLVLVLGLTDKTKLGEWLRGALVSHGAGDDSHRRDTGIFFLDNGSFIILGLIQPQVLPHSEQPKTHDHIHKCDRPYEEPIYGLRSLELPCHPNRDINSLVIHSSRLAPDSIGSLCCT